MTVKANSKCYSQTYSLALKWNHSVELVFLFQTRQSGLRWGST